MNLETINFVNFRNLNDSSIKFSPFLNLFFGKNGQGKTSVLEAIYFNCTGKSFRSNRAQELIKHGRDRCGTFVNYSDRLSKKSLTVKFSDKKKEYLLNGNKVTHQEFYGRLAVVAFTPEDIDIITGTPGRRRSFFDEEISQSSGEYYSVLKDFNKILKIRNQYLKETKTEDPLYNVYEEQFINLGAKIVFMRAEYVKRISIILNLNYRKLFDSTKEMGVTYFSELELEKRDTLKTIEEKIKIRIEKKFSQEKRYGHSLVGPQRDEFKFLLDGKEAKFFASQGEKKSIVFSFKLSELDMIFKEKGENPIFLIDDITSYFDENRRESVMNHLQRKRIQLFISSTEKIPGIEGRNFHVTDGEIRCED
ncbi:MAG: DNA replication/repair protein RecF [Fusobacteriaceae bacterium]